MLFTSEYPTRTASIPHRSESTSISTSMLVPEKTTPSEVVIEINDRVPSYKLATRFGDNPKVDGDQAQAKLLEELRLYEICQRDPSTIVVDVGASLGNFGLYAAACGCTVYIFEIQPEMIAFIRSSIKHNSFSSSHIYLFHNAVSDLPSNTILNFSPEGSQTVTKDGSIQVQSIRLDDISWSSSSIFILKIDVQGFELNVLRSAKKLFDEKRIRHLIFGYSPWLTDRAPQETLLPYVKIHLRAKYIYALHRTEKKIYGLLNRKHLLKFYDQYFKSHLKTNIYAVFDKKAFRSSIKAETYDPNTNFD